MSPAPLVSVVMSTWNRAGLVTRAVHSVMGQTYRDLELIVIDNGSTDRTPEALAAIRDPRLRIIRIAVNAGAAAARNAGIRAARGQLIAFHDDDDVWFARKLEHSAITTRMIKIITRWKSPPPITIWMFWNAW